MNKSNMDICYKCIHLKSTNAGFMSIPVLYCNVNKKEICDIPDSNEKCKDFEKSGGR
jgi:hypothetical protein